MSSGITMAAAARLTCCINRIRQNATEAAARNLSQSHRKCVRQIVNGCVPVSSATAVAVKPVLNRKKTAVRQSSGMMTV